MAPACQTVTHPAVAGTQIQNAQPILRHGGNTRQNLPLDIPKGARPHCPLPAMQAGKIAVGKCEVVIGARTSPTFRGADAFIVLYESRIARGALGQKRFPYPSLASQSGFAS